MAVKVKLRVRHCLGAASLRPVRGEEQGKGYFGLRWNSLGCTHVDVYFARLLAHTFFISSLFFSARRCVPS